MGVDLRAELSDAEIAAARVVVVDDEPVILDSLANFFDIELGIDAKVFERPADVIAYVESEEIDLVVSDYLMPDMSGIELLRQIKALRPHVPRILLTGYADKENAIEAINTVRLYQYLEKPWESARLRATVIGALQQRHLMRLLMETADELSEANENLADLRGAMLRAFA